MSTQAHWLSFADPDLPEGRQFLGVCVVEAESFQEAVIAASLREINPGGECRGWQAPADEMEKWSLKREHWNRLLGRGDLLKLCEDGVVDMDGERIGAA